MEITYCVSLTEIILALRCRGTFKSVLSAPKTPQDVAILTRDKIYCTNMPRGSRVSVQALAKAVGKHQARANVGGTHNKTSFNVGDPAMTQPDKVCPPNEEVCHEDVRSNEELLSVSADPAYTHPRSPWLICKKDATSFHKESDLVKDTGPTRYEIHSDVASSSAESQ